MAISAVNPHVLGEIVCKAMDIDPDQVARIIIDINATKNDPVFVYVEMVASLKMLELDWETCLKGAEIKVVDK